MNLQHLLCICAAVAFLVTSVATEKMEMEMEKVEESTVSAIADMAMIDAEMKTSTEKPPIASNTASTTGEKPDQKDDTQRHTVADFIIHPLIAFKPRSPEDESPNVSGKQASSSTTTPSPWQLFGFNAGQGLGSSVSSLAGSVTGWINDRIQLPGLVDTPVRESTTTSTSSTTTPRPDVVVRVQHKASTRRPIISITNNNRPNRPNNNNLNFDSEEDDDDYEDDDDEFQNNFSNNNNNNSKNKRKNNNRINHTDNDNDDNDDDEEEEEDDNRRGHDEDEEEAEEYDDADEHDENDDDEDFEDDDDEEVVSQRPNNRRRPIRNQQQQRHREPQQHRRNTQRGQYGTQRQHSSELRPVKRRRQQHVEADDSDSEEFYYGGHTSGKRSQSQTGFIQRGQQNLINQIRQLTRGKTPAEIGQLMRQPQSGKKKRRQQATLVVNRNGQTVYMAPELLNADVPLVNPQYQYISQMHRQTKPSEFPQPPLTMPLKRKGRPTQYITIPWSQLGIAPPDQIVSITEGVQSQPLILNIPQSAINTMSNPNRKKKRRPAIKADAVPLLAEASLMDVFKPPKIPPSRHSTSPPAAHPHRPSAAAGTPVIIASKTKPSSSINKNTPSHGHQLPHRIRSGTIVEKAPLIADQPHRPEELPDESSSSSQINDDQLRRSGDDEFIIVGEDNDPGLTRQVQPVFGDARYVYGAGANPYYELFNNGRFAIRKGGRSLERPENGAIVSSKITDVTEQQIPVHIIHEGETTQAQQPEHKEEAVTVAQVHAPQVKEEQKAQMSNSGATATVAEVASAA